MRDGWSANLWAFSAGFVVGILAMLAAFGEVIEHCR